MSCASNVSKNEGSGAINQVDIGEKVVSRHAEEKV